MAGAANTPRLMEHMPPDHQKYLEWNGDRFRRWADSIGINTRKVVDAILTSGRVEQQTYRSCMGLLKLAEKHSPSKLEEACKLAEKHSPSKLEEACSRALLYSRTPSYKSIKNLLAAMKEAFDPVSQNPDSISSETQSQARGITRGARYYGGKRS